MARQYSDDERAEILAKSYELLARDVTDTRQVSEPEWSREEIRQLAFAPPVERRNTRIRREYDEEKARKMETMAQLEARLNAKIAAETDRVFKTISEVVATGIYEPYDKKFEDLREEINTMRARVGVGIVAAAINLNGQLMLTLSDGTVLTPGVVVGREELKRARAEATPPIDLPNVLEARRWR